MTAMLRRLAGARAALLSAAVLTILSSVPAFAAAVNAPGVRVPPHQRIVLPGGITLVLMPQREVPLTSFSRIHQAPARRTSTG